MLPVRETGSGRKRVDGKRGLVQTCRSGSHALAHIPPATVELVPGWHTEVHLLYQLMWHPHDELLPYQDPANTCR